MKTERRQELKTNELGVFLLDANDWLKQNGTKVAGGVVAILVLVFAINAMRRASVEQASEATRRFAEVLPKLTGEDWEAGFTELDTLIQDAGSRNFRMQLLLTKASIAEQRVTSAEAFKSEFVNLADEAFSTLVSDFGDRGLVKARAQLGLAVVAENRFVTDRDPKHKDRARDLLTAVSESKIAQGTPLQTTAVERLNRLDETFTIVALADPPPPPAGPPAPTEPDIQIKAPEGVEVKKLDGPPQELLDRIKKAQEAESGGDEATDPPADDEGNQTPQE